MTTNMSRRDKVPAWPPVGKDGGEHLRRESVDRAEGVYQGLEAKQRGRHPLLHFYDLQRGISVMHAWKSVRGARTSLAWILVNLQSCIYV